jgi:hypothetical protein
MLQQVKDALRNQDIAEGGKPEPGTPLYFLWMYVAECAVTLHPILEMAGYDSPYSGICEDE